MVARSPEEYVRIAAGLAGDLKRLGEIRAALRGTMKKSALMDAAGVTRNLEAAYREAWREWCARPR